MTQKFHIALEVLDIANSVDEYSKRLGCITFHNLLLELTHVKRIFIKTIA